MAVYTVTHAKVPDLLDRITHASNIAMALRAVESVIDVN
jgi:hypothetical protein